MVSVKSRWGQGQWLGWWASCVRLSVTWALSSPVFVGWWVFQENIMGCPAWSSYLWLTTFLDSCGGSRQARGHFRINPPQRVLCLSPASFTYPLQGANLQTLPGPWRVAQSSAAGRLGGRARLESLMAPHANFLTTLPLAAPTFPTIRGIWFLGLSAF